MYKNKYVVNLAVAVVSTAVLFGLSRTDEKKPSMKLLARNLVVVFVALCSLEYITPMVLKGGAMAVSTVSPIASEAVPVLREVNLGDPNF